MFKVLLFFSLLVGSISAKAQQIVPRLVLEYSYGLDLYCAPAVTPETLTPWQLAMIPKIPNYRSELLDKMPWFQSEWNRTGTPLMLEAARVIGKGFPVTEIRAAVFLCPRFPSMGTPLALNIISYLESTVKDIPSLDKPLPIFFFVSTTFHELLHKYINAILIQTGSDVIARVNEPDLVKAHLHLFALQKLVFESLNIGQLLPQIQKLEAIHGPDYVRAWNLVHNDEALFTELINELKR